MNKRKILWSAVAVLTFVLIGFICLTRINFLDYEKPIPYGRIDEITFKNFRGMEFFQKSLYGNKSFAYIYTSIEYEFEDDSLSIQSFFHPSRSYVYNKKAYSKDLLRHELYHFRITELYARIAKKRIAALNAPTESEIEDLITVIKKQEDNYQRAYDDDTFHSYVLSKQKKYEKDVDSLLSLYGNYSKPKIFINEQ